MKFDDLKFIRIQDFNLIPRYLMEQSGSGAAKIDRILQFGSGIAKDPLTLLYVLADPQNKIKGFVWAEINLFEKRLEINTISVDPDYQDGKEVSKIKYFLAGLLADSKLKKEVLGDGDLMSARVKLWSYYEDMERLRPIAEDWANTASDNEFGVDVDADSHLSDLRGLICGSTSGLIVLLKENQPVGYIGLKVMQNPIGHQLIANEHYWYVLPEYRGMGSMKMLKAAMLWAKLHNCSHIILNASRLASEMHDKVCLLYDKLGMKLFETSYIKEIE